MAEHDPSYIKLFSHPQMVEDLLLGFVDEEWVAEVDFSTLETVKDSFITDDLRKRYDDIIWRVRWGDRWLYVYLLMEFQSSVNSFMAVRLMVYVGLLYQHLIDMEKLTKKDKLPPVLPLVIYNGKNRWDAKRDISDLIEEVPGGLEKYRPHMRYFLIDESGFSDAELAAPLHNLAAALFRMENSRSKKNRKEVIQAVREVLGQLTEWLKEPARAGLRRDFTTWLLRVFLPHNVPGIQIPEAIELQEMNDMLYETAQSWYKEAEAKGKRDGKIEGKAEGEAQMLAYILESKFGTLGADEQAQVHGLDSKALFACSRRVLTARTLQEALGKAN
ncbi:MAG: Rpn family recombination-promoting nuclease/putative transposase [Gammaproteobacteria bacterium]|nr:Rpn family recombination-promoting nuclease/putative transposase [Gammaproteobacteria bacterium]